MSTKSAHARQSGPPTDEEVKQAMEILRRFEEHAQSKQAQDLLVRTDESISEEAPETVSGRTRPNRPNPEALAALYERMNWFFATRKRNELKGASADEVDHTNTRPNTDHDTQPSNA